MSAITRLLADFDRLALRVAGDDPSGYDALMRYPLTRFTLVCEEYLQRLVSAKKARDKAERKRTFARHGRASRH